MSKIYAGNEQKIRNLTLSDAESAKSFLPPLDTLNQDSGQHLMIPAHLEAPKAPITKQIGNAAKAIVGFVIPKNPNAK